MQATALCLTIDLNFYLPNLIYKLKIETRNSRQVGTAFQPKINVVKVEWTITFITLAVAHFIDDFSIAVLKVQNVIITCWES